MRTKTTAFYRGKTAVEVENLAGKISSNVVLVLFSLY